MTWLIEFIKHPKELGAITESSPFLTQRVLETAALNGTSKVLELGPGRGAITEKLPAHYHSGRRYLGLEINDTFVDELQKRFPGLNVEKDSASSFDFAKYTAEHGLFDVVISGLPFSTFSEAMQRRIIENVYQSLAPGGLLVAYGYQGFNLLPGGRAFFELLDETFGDVRKMQPVLLNLPPAFVYRCQK